MASVARMRTIDGLYEEIHLLDPQSQVSKHFVRQLVITGKVKSTRSGAKYLVNLDSVLDYLANPPDEIEEPEAEPEYGKLRRAVL